MKSKFSNLSGDSIYIEIKPCPECKSRKIYISGGEIVSLLGIKRIECHVECEQCGYKGGIGHTVTSAVSYWNSVERKI